jgi:DNA-binding response OmpR family regulator
MAEMDSQIEAQDNARIVMLIDDEPAQSRLITAIAARDGWRTIVAPDADIAIAVLGTHEGMQLSAILLDQ